jgi:hypothetical protein
LAAHKIWVIEVVQIELGNGSQPNAGSHQPDYRGELFDFH